MPRYIAFLRAINVGGHVVKMDRLKSLFESLGFSAVETFIASGNVIFESRSSAEATLQRKIEKCLHDTLGYEVATMLRTDAEVAAVAMYQPFAKAARKAAVAFNVGFVASPFDKSAARAVMKLKTDLDDLHVSGREIYWLCKVRQSDSRFTCAVFEKAMGVRATFRNVNTVMKLAAKYPPDCVRC
jgi:uncharacterized protein (DUF1697 family)